MCDVCGHTNIIATPYVYDRVYVYKDVNIITCNALADIVDLLKAIVQKYEADNNICSFLFPLYCVKFIRGY
jgi:hypothetical protein